jgi:hypothetical protein
MQCQGSTTENALVQLITVSTSTGGVRASVTGLVGGKQTGSTTCWPQLSSIRIRILIDHCERKEVSIAGLMH